MKEKILVSVALIIAILAAAGCAGETVPEAEQTTIAAAEQTDAPVTEQTTVPETTVDYSLAKVAPLPISFDPVNPDNCTVNVYFEMDSIIDNGDGTYAVRFGLYTYDTYDMVDIAQLQKGDTIVLRNEIVTVEKIEETQNGSILINAIDNEDGTCLVPTDDGVYYVDTYSFIKDFKKVGEATLPISPDFVFTDSYDPDDGTVVQTLEDIVRGDRELDYDFRPYNSTIVVENGQVISLTRIYTP